MAKKPIEELKDFGAGIKQKLNIPAQLLLMSSIKTESELRGISIEEVRKNKFQDVIKKLQEETTSNVLQFGVIERESSAFKKFLTAVHVLFTPEQLKKIREEARNHAEDHRVKKDLKTPTSKELKDSMDFFENKFKGYKKKSQTPEREKDKKEHDEEESVIPDAELLVQHALELQKLRLAIQRLLAEPDIRISSRGDLRSIVRRKPDVGVDIGIILLTKELLDKIECTHENELSWHRALQSAGKSMQDDISTFFSKDLEGVGKQIEATINFSKKNYFWGPVSLLFVPARLLAVAAFRAIFAVPKALLIGSKDAFVATASGNERPKK